MYSIGEQIIYGGMGVCTITDIGQPDLPGAKESYVLKPHYVANAKVYAPIQKNNVTMRPLLTSGQMCELIDSMPEIDPFPTSGERQELHNTWRAALKSADSFMLAKLLKTLYQRKQQIIEQKKTVPSAEKELFDTAERMLFGEIAVVMDIPVDEVQSYIDTRTGKAPAKAAS